MIDEGTFYKEASALYGEDSEVYDAVVKAFDHLARYDEAQAIEVLRNVTVQEFAREHGLVPERQHEHGIGERLI